MRKTYFTLANSSKQFCLEFKKWDVALYSFFVLSSSKPRIRSPPGKNDHGAGAGAGINVGASGDASRETRSATPPRSSMTRHPSPGPRGNSASSSGGKRQPSPCAAPTGFAAYKHLFDCIDYRYLPSTESASLTCELLHHMLTNNQAAKLRLERAYESVRLTY